MMVFYLSRTGSISTGRIFSIHSIIQLAWGRSPYQCEIIQNHHKVSPGGLTPPRTPQLIVNMPYDVMIGECSCKVLPIKYN